jgi:hypothetical protein
MQTKIVNIVSKYRRNNPQLARLRHMEVYTLHDALVLGRQTIDILTQICEPEVREILTALKDIPHVNHRGEDPLNLHIYNEQYRKWENAAAHRSSVLRNILNPETVMVTTKMMNFRGEEQAMQTFRKIKKINSISLKTKVLRLIHGDVFCGTKLVKAKLAEIDTCIRCFETETKEHLISQCPYSRQIWREYGIADPTLSNIINPEISDAEFEIRSSLLETIVFRKQHIPPDTVLLNTFMKYAQGIGKSKKLTDYAKTKIVVKGATGSWF